jgi:YHS domain-containing protein
MAVVLATQVVAEDAKKMINTNWFGVAIKGYDTVAYFTEGGAIKGKKEFEFKWQGARWRFASATNRDLFAANPERYAPKYGGF